MSLSMLRWRGRWLLLGTLALAIAGAWITADAEPRNGAAPVVAAAPAAHDDGGIVVVDRVPVAPTAPPAPKSTPTSAVSGLDVTPGTALLWLAGAMLLLGALRRWRNDD
jgi:hypothetical protein